MPAPIEAKAAHLSAKRAHDRREAETGVEEAVQKEHGRTRCPALPTAQNEAADGEVARLKEAILRHDREDTRARHMPAPPLRWGAMPDPLSLKRAALGLAFLGLATAASAQEARSGAEVYKQLCVICHGESGDGKGIVQLDRPARSFRDGGFSFGNTKEAIARTVASGIGGTPMPGFAAMLSEAELEAVAEYVIAFGPEQPPSPDAAMRLTVGERPLIVRGHLPPVASGAADHPRGLLVGTLDGLSWEYAADDFRLIAVRQGEFVSREDWKGRGGTPLKPLGRVIHRRQNEGERSEFVQAYPQHIASAVMRSTAYHGKLKATEVRDGRAWIESEVMEGEQLIASVRESASAFSFSTVAGYRRQFEVTREKLANKPLHFMAGMPQARGEVEQMPLDNAGFACFVPTGEDSGVAYFFEARNVLKYNADANGVSVEIPMDQESVGFAVTTFPLPAGAKAAWAQIKKELLP